MALLSSGTASASNCGYNDNINGRAIYNHCGSTTVLIEYTLFSGSHWNLCVRPGETDMGDSWLVSDAWYVGGVGCTPN
jgi:hypothetical protein